MPHQNTRRSWGAVTTSWKLLAEQGFGPCLILSEPKLTTTSFTASTPGLEGFRNICWSFLRKSCGETDDIKCIYSLGCNKNPFRLIELYMCLFLGVNILWLLPISLMETILFNVPTVRSIKVFFIFLLLNNNSVMFWCFSCSGPVAPGRDVYYDLAKKLFGEEKLSTHPVPEYMEAREVPRYVAS